MRGLGKTILPRRVDDIFSRRPLSLRETRCRNRHDELFSPSLLLDLPPPQPQKWSQLSTMKLPAQCQLATSSPGSALSSCVVLSLKPSRGNRPPVSLRSRRSF